MSRKTYIILITIPIFLMTISLGLSDTRLDDIDSLGCRLYNQEQLPKTTRKAISSTSILVFNPFLDVPERLRSLGYTVNETTNISDLNRINLQNYNVLWISVDTNPSTYSSQNFEIQAWINQDGGGLIINQPSVITSVTVFPACFEVYIYDNWWPPGDINATIVDHGHPITYGLNDDDLSINGDWVKSSDIGLCWGILAVGAKTPDAVALLAGEYGAGKMVFNTGNFDLLSTDPGSDQFLIQMVDWAGSSFAPIPDIKANGLDKEVTIISGESFPVTVALQANDLSSTNCDWWCVAQTPWGWYYYDYLTDEWLEGFKVTYKGPCLDLDTFEVLDMILPDGDYIFYFGVDDNMNGSFDGNQYYDSVDVSIVP